MRAYRPNDDQTWRDVYSREYGAAEGRGLQSWQAREEAAQAAWRDYETRTGKSALMRNGFPREVPPIDWHQIRPPMTVSYEGGHYYVRLPDGTEARATWDGWDEDDARRAVGYLNRLAQYEPNASDSRDAWNEDVRRALASAGQGNRPFSVRELTGHLQGRLPSNTVRYQVSRLARAGYVTFDESGTIGITNLGWNWIEGAPRHASNASGYYVWALARGSNAPLAEGPWGPYATLESAKTFARIGATEGAHDRAVSVGLDPKVPRFQIVRRYQAGTGERLL